MRQHPFQLERQDNVYVLFSTYDTNPNTLTLCLVVEKN